MKDLGPLHHFLGMRVQHWPDRLFLSQHQYVLDILDRPGMAAYKPCSTPIDTNPKLSLTAGTPLSAADVADFRRLARALQYLTFTRADITCIIEQVFLYMHAPWDSHLATLKRILRYIRDTLHLGLRLRLCTVDKLVIYSDADWASCPDTHKPTSGYAVFIRDNLIS
jgi:hypothetical protein